MFIQCGLCWLLNNIIRRYRVYVTHRITWRFWWTTNRSSFVGGKIITLGKCSSAHTTHVRLFTYIWNTIKVKERHDFPIRIPVWVRMCITSLSERAKRRLHKLQLNGFSPVCFLIKNGFLLWFDGRETVNYLMWMVKSVVRGYPLPQTLQKLVIFPEWRLMCTAKLLIELQLLPQTLHKITFLFSMLNGPVRFLCDRMWTSKWFECFIRFPHTLHS